MFRYQPPKSSVWGHLLRKMPAAREKKLFDEFLAAAVAQRKFSSATLSIQDPSGETVARYERLVGTMSRNGRFDALTFEQSEKCIDELIRDQASGETTANHLNLGQSFEITKWRVDGQEAPTQSLLSVHYGQLPCLITFLQFETLEHFQSVQRVLADIGLCKLNDKHLKPMKPGKTN